MSYLVAVFFLAFAAAFCLLHPRVHTGFGGALSGGVVSVSAIAGMEHDPPEWATLLVFGTALSMVWYAAKELRRGK